MDRFARFFSLSLVSLALVGCGRSSPHAEVVPRSEAVRDGDELVKGTGTVVWYAVEGGFYAIRAGEMTYDPINLPASFRKDGFRVYFEAKLRNDLASNRMAGPLIELVKISPK